jgi:hypothetical protein
MVLRGYFCNAHARALTRPRPQIFSAGVLGDPRVSSSFRRELKTRPQGIRRALDHMK